MFCTIDVLSLYGRYVIRFFLPDGVFLPCGHGLDLLHQPIREFNQFNQNQYIYTIKRETFTNGCSYYDGQIRSYVHFIKYNILSSRTHVPGT